MDAGKPVDIVYRDFQKAFDVVPHQSIPCFEQAFANPEDVASFGKDEAVKKYLRTDPDVERVRR